MTQQKSSVLSDYQVAVLNGIGIPLFQLRNKTGADDVSNVIESSPTAKTPLRPASQQAALDRLKTELKKPSLDAQGKAVLHFEQDAKVQDFVRDVLHALGFTQKDMLNMSPRDTKATHGAGLEWHIGEQFNYQDSVLTTPPVKSLLTPESKLALWRSIQGAG